MVGEGVKIFASKIRKNSTAGTGHLFEINAKKLAAEEFFLHSSDVPDSQIHISQEQLLGALDDVKNKEYLNLADFDDFFHNPDNNDPLKYISNA